MKNYFESVQYKEDIPVKPFTVSIENCPPHWHEEIEIIAVLDGNVVISTPKRIYTLTNKDILVINSKEVHQFLHADVENRLLILQIRPTFLRAYLNMPTNISIKCNSLDSGGEFDEAFAKISEFMSMVLKEYELKRNGYKSFIVSYVSTILSYVFRYFDSKVIDDDEHLAQNSNLKRLNDIFNFVKEKFTYDICLKDVADVLHLNYYYLSHFFKEQTGTQFSKFLDEIRLERAKELLLEGNLKLMDIAMESGFKSDKRLYSIFKSSYGLTPMQYKESKIKDKDSKNKNNYNAETFYNISIGAGFEKSRDMSGLKDLMVYKTIIHKVFNGAKYYKKGDLVMSSNKISFVIKANESDTVLKFGVSELQYFLEAFGNNRINETSGLDKDYWIFELSTDKSLKNKSFSISCAYDTVSMRTKASLKGEDSSCVLSAVYTLLEKAGIMFEITGPVMPSELSLEEIIGWSEVINPVVLLRGIRQHINFPMDISSYTLTEAKEYIRNVARMRFNHISFHSYYGQWYRAKLPNKEIRAGWFFYGQVHNIPTHPILREFVHNNEIYCVPEIEQVFHEPDKRSDAAIAWLRDVMDEAKRVGLDIQLSIELWDAENNCIEPHENMIVICDSIMKDYPLIDTLEFITREAGGCTGIGTSREDIIKQISELFSNEMAEKIKEKNILGDITYTLYECLNEIAAAINLVDELKKRYQGLRIPCFTIGVYTVYYDALKAVLEVMRSFIPCDVGFSFLASHGARSVYLSITEMPFIDSDISKTMFYSWSEFDGDMYLIQNQIEGNLDLITHLLQKRTEPIHGYAVNHWRTSENKTSLRFISEATLKGPMGAEVFYRTYGQSLGIKPFWDFSKAMHLIDLSEIDARKMMNVAFSFVGCWVNNKLGYISSWDKNNISPIVACYQSILQYLGTCIEMTDNAKGKEYLEFLINRVECSKIYFSAISKIMEVKDIAGDRTKDELAGVEREMVKKICDEALLFTEEYMKHHVKYMPDRGCEGTLISFYHTLPAFITRIRLMYGEGKDTKLCEFYSPDAPPSPEH